jgi:hypothetical protein
MPDCPEDSRPRITPSNLTPEQRADVLRGLDSYFEKVDRRRRPVSDEEEARIITEAIRSVRPNYRPVD